MLVKSAPWLLVLMLIPGLCLAASPDDVKTTTEIQAELTAQSCQMMTPMISEEGLAEAEASQEQADDQATAEATQDKNQDANFALGRCKLTCELCWTPSDCPLFMGWPQQCVAYCL